MNGLILFLVPPSPAFTKTRFAIHTKALNKFGRIFIMSSDHEVSLLNEMSNMSYIVVLLAGLLCFTFDSCTLADLPTNRRMLRHGEMTMTSPLLRHRHLPVVPQFLPCHHPLAL